MKEKESHVKQVIVDLAEEKKIASLFRIKQLIADLIEEKEFEKWFVLKQLLAEIILADLKEEWRAGYLPSTDSRAYYMNNKLTEMVNQSFIYLKERGEIYIMENPNRATNTILGKEWVKLLGTKGKVDRDKNKIV